MYFSSFPKTLYTFNLKENSPVTVTNIFSRFKVRSAVLNNALAFYKYQVIDGETPEIIAYKMYDDPQYHWVICLCNDLIDPQFDMPLDISSLEKKIIKKYGYASIEEAMSDIHHYELVVNKLYTQTDGFSTETTEKNEVTLKQYDYTSNTVVTKVINQPVVEDVVFRANTADINSAAVGTMTTTSTYREVNVYDYELSQNENKRSLNILKKQYIPLVTNELELMIHG
jgi:hypothetical protein